jgi:heme exporter protein D
MNWHSAAEFVDMGGYALYVWGAYSLAALVIAIEVWLVTKRRRRALAGAIESSQEQVWQ